VVECNLAKVDVEGSNPFSRSAKLKQNRPVSGLALAGFFVRGATCGGWGTTRGTTRRTAGYLFEGSSAKQRKFNLASPPTEDVAEEEPNSLLPEQVPLFLERLRELHPQHYAMAFLGLCTGLRPSSLRPLRRRGPETDVIWDKNRILVRRSQTRGEHVMKSTKQRTRYCINVPQTVTDV
jgi:integrase